MAWAILASALPALVVGSALAAVPPTSEASGESGRSGLVQLVQMQCVYGPFATQRRAYEVMHQIQASGYDAWVVPAGNEEWYVRVC